MFFTRTLGLHTGEKPVYAVSESPNSRIPIWAFAGVKTAMLKEQNIKTNIFDVCEMEHSSSMQTGDITSIPEPVKGYNDPEDLPGEVETLYLQLARTLRGCGDMHSCATDLLLFDRALTGGKLIDQESLAEMFNNDMSYSCGWINFMNYDNVWYHGGESYFYLGYNMYLKTEKYGNLYLIQLHPTVAGDEYSNKLLSDIATEAIYIF